MSKLTVTEVRGLMEAYSAVYAPEESLEQEIFETVAYTLISQGYTAIDVLEYFANVDEEVIVEDILAIAEGTLLVESVVSEEYLQEQYEVLNEALPAIASGLGLGLRALAGAGARRTAGVVLKRMAGPGVRKAVGGVVKKIGGAVGKVKDVARGALNKLPGGSGGKLASGLKTAGKWALGGAAFEAGARGVKALMGNKGPSPKTAPSGDKAKYNASAALGGQAAFKAGGGAAAMKKDPKLTAADVQKRGTEALFKAGGGSAAMTQKGQTRAQVIAQGSKNVAPKAAAPKPAPAAPAAPAKPAAATPATKPATPAKPPAGTTETPKRPSITQDIEDIKQMQQRSRQRQGVEMGGPEGPGKIDTASVQADLKKAQEREKKKATAATTKESYDAFDIVLEYLLENGHADTEIEAAYIMTEMDSKTIADIVENRGMAYSGGKPGASGDGSRPKGITGGTTYKMKGWDDDTPTPKKATVKGV